LPWSTFNRDTTRSEDEDDASADDPDGTRDAPITDSVPAGVPETVGVGVLTVGTVDGTDHAGARIATAVEDAGHDLVVEEPLAPDFDAVQESVSALADRETVHAVVLVGGTGIGPTDVSVEAVQDLCTKGLPGFGETVRRLAYEDASPAVVGDRTTAGVIDDLLVFCLSEDPDVTDTAGELVASWIEPLVADLRT
jgi:molybdenum cofactor biosynthesis protein B